MALIKCIECGKDFSDKASACPNCGCPIEEIQKTLIEHPCIINGKLYNFDPYYDEIMEYVENDRAGRLCILLNKITGYNENTFKPLYRIIFDTKTIPEKIDLEIITPRASNPNKPKCPKCGSTSIQIVQRKHSFWGGFATEKVDRVCVNCKHRW